ncbi:PE-PGRS family protein [Streptomyces inhibens]|uniref:PE-PGRS family protein n=1 Tax=Streptomyces inhibens TaxID=2293571 RepID=UPI0036AA12D3
MTTGPAARAARAAIFATVCVTTTVLGHGLMSAQPVPWWAVTAAFGATGAAAWWLTGRERGAVVVTGCTVSAQLGLHSLFGFSQQSAAGTGIAASSDNRWAERLFCNGSGTDPALRASALRLLRQAGLDPLATQAPPPTPMSGMRGMAEMATMSGMGHAGAMAGDMGPMGHLQMTHSGHGTLGMFLAHALAAFVCGIWLWRGEAAVFQLARSLAAALFAPLLLVLRTLGRTGGKLPVRRVVSSHVLCLRGALLQYAVSRRGPPRLSVC